MRPEDMIVRMEQDLEEQNKVLGQQYGRAFADPARPEDRKKLSVLMTELNVANPDEERRTIQWFVIEYLGMKLREVTLAEMVLMMKTGMFNGHSRMKIEVGFCRNLFDIPPNEEVTSEHMRRLHGALTEFDEGQGSLSSGEWKDRLNYWSFRLMGIEIRMENPERIGKILEWVESSWGFHCAPDPDPYINLIFGRVRRMEYAGFGGLVFDKELIRSPGCPLTLAGQTDGAGRFIVRPESTVRIIHAKYGSSGREEERLLSSPSIRSKNDMITRGLIERLQSLYGVEAGGDLTGYTEVLNERMTLGVMAHEAGHLLARKDEPVPTVHFDNEETGLIQLIQEILADYHPSEDAPISRMCRMAGEDETAALSEVVCYLSDAYGVSPIEWMKLYTDVMSSLLLSFFRQDGTFDFARLKSAQEGIYRFALGELHAVMERILNIIRTGRYWIGGKMQGYSALAAHVRKTFRQDGKMPELSELEKREEYWKRIWRRIALDQRGVPEKLQLAFRIAAEGFRRNLAKQIPTRRRLREYLFDQYESLGLVIRPSDEEMMKAVSALIRTMDVGAEAEEVIRQDLARILSGGSIEIRMEQDYPFAAVIREMMRVSGYGGIGETYLVGEASWLAPEFPDRRERVREALNELKKMIGRWPHRTIRTLIVDRDLASRDEIESLLQSVSLDNGDSLRDRIGNVEEGDVPEKAVFECTGTLEGYMDTLLFCAIAGLNIEISEGALWTIGRDFFETLSAGYFRALDASRKGEEMRRSSD